MTLDNVVRLEAMLATAGLAVDEGKAPPVVYNDGLNWYISSLGFIQYRSFTIDLVILTCRQHHNTPRNCLCIASYSLSQELGHYISKSVPLLPPSEGSDLTLQQRSNFHNNLNHHQHRT